MNWTEFFSTLPDFLRAFYFSFLPHAVPFLSLTLLFGIVFLRWGGSFGLTSLFWHNHNGKQTMVGAALGLVTAHIAFVGFLLMFNPEKRTWWIEEVIGKLPDIFPRLGHFEVDAKLYLWFYGYLLLLIVALAVLALLIRFLAGALRPSKLAMAGVARWPLPLGFVLATGGVLLLIDPIMHVSDDLADTGFATAILTSLGQNDEQVDQQHALALVVMALVVVVYAALSIWGRRGRRFPASVMICALLSMLCGAYGVIASTGGVLGGAGMVIVLLALLFVGGLPMLKYRIRFFPRAAYAKKHRADLKSYYADPPAPDTGPPPIAPTDVRWHGRDDTGPLVIFCAAGGGITSAAWTLRVLTEIERQSPHFSRSTKVICGASGGLVGAAYWTATLQAPAGDNVSDHGVGADDMFARMSSDALSPVASRLVLHDWWRALFFPASVGRDRGDALESAWSENLHGALDVTMGSLREGEVAGWRPSLIFSPTTVEDARRLVISNLDCSGVVQARTNYLGGGTEQTAVSGVELRRLAALSKRWKAEEFPLSTAARMSASFTYVSPAAYIPTEPPRRVVDAGYYDNFGVDVAGMWLGEYWAGLDDAARAAHPGVLLVEAIAYPRGLTCVECGAAAPGAGPGRAIEGLTGPWSAILNAREGTAAQRNEEVLQHWSTLLGDKFQHVRISLPDAPPLNWRLTPEQADVIREGVKAQEPAGDIAAVAQWVEARWA